MLSLTFIQENESKWLTSGVFLCLLELTSQFREVRVFNVLRRIQGCTLTFRHFKLTPPDEVQSLQHLPHPHSGFSNSSMVTRSRCGDGVSVVMTVPHRVELIWPRTQSPCLVRRSVAVKFISYRENRSRKCWFPAKCVGIFDHETFTEVRKWCGFSFAWKNRGWDGFSSRKPPLSWQRSES